MPTGVVRLLETHIRLTVPLGMRFKYIVKAPYVVLIPCMIKQDVTQEKYPQAKEKYIHENTIHRTTNIPDQRKRFSWTTIVKIQSIHEKISIF